MLNKENRLRKTADFLEVYEKGTHVVARQMVVYYLPNPHGGIRVGFVASKKVGKSSERSRCKRLLRESMRRQLPGLALNYDIVVVARPPLREEGFAVINRVLTRLLHKGGLFRRDR